jgi:hypothetical protein
MYTVHWARKVGVFGNLVVEICPLPYHILIKSVATNSSIIAEREIIPGHVVGGTLVYQLGMIPLTLLAILPN